MHLLKNILSDESGYKAAKEYAEQVSTQEQFPHQYNSAFCGYRNALKQTSKEATEIEVLDIEQISKDLYVRTGITIASIPQIMEYLKENNIIMIKSLQNNDTQQDIR